jgi:hypothetical protein
MARSPTPSGIRLGIVRGISYGLFGPPDSVAPEMRDLGSTLARVYLYWGQVEPEPGRFDWTVVEAILNQVESSDELWVTVCSSSSWATRAATTFLPPSPAKDEHAYVRFVRTLVAHCRGRVDFWQCNNEPSNTGLLWAGTAPEYVAQIEAFYRAVRAADPDTSVVLGGCGYDVLSSAEGSPARQFFDYIVDHGRDAFDLFSVHLYDDPTRIPAHVESVRQMMRRHGFERPVVVGEYNGPTLFEFPQAEARLQETMLAAFAGNGPPGQDVAERSEHPAGEPADRRAMRALYADMSHLPPQLQMFMDGCPPELAAKRDRINCRQIVTRNLFALSAGVTRTACWNLAPEIPNYTDRYNMMGFLFGKLALMDYDSAALRRHHRSAQTFRLLARSLAGASSVTRLAVAGHPELVAFAVQREGRGPLHVLWKDGDVFTGEDEPPEPITWEWPSTAARVVDVFGIVQPVEHEPNALRLSVSVTPILVATDQPG